MYFHCPQCQEQTCYIYTYERRKYARCLTCGLECLLKLLSLHKA